MFWSNFDNFYGSNHHQSRLGARKVEDRGWMTRFCTINILTLFVMQFLSFRINTTKNYFGQLLMIF